MCVCVRACILRHQTLLKAVCEDMHTFLAENPLNVVAVHCKAGKVWWCDLGMTAPYFCVRLSRRVRPLAAYRFGLFLQGRTGLVICCYLLYSGLCETATLALNRYGEARTYNNKGVTIASQIRYVYYFSQLLRSSPAPVEYTYKIRHIRIITVPNFDVVRWPSHSVCVARCCAHP